VRSRCVSPSALVLRTDLFLSFPLFPLRPHPFLPLLLSFSRKQDDHPWFEVFRFNYKEW
jgi:hypothetical protein